MNTKINPQIATAAASFNSFHDYDLDAALELTATVIRHLHMVQLARKEQADPQLVLPIDLPQ